MLLFQFITKKYDWWKRRFNDWVKVKKTKPLFEKEIKYVVIKNQGFEVDMVIISWARDNKLKEITEKGIRSCIKNDSNVKFNFFVVETNKDVIYDLPNTTTIHPKGKYGYHKYLNIGRKAGNAKYVCLCNNDLTYEKNWATQIIGLMEAKTEIKSASPWCPQILGKNTVYIDKVYLGYRIRVELAGWCIFQQREIYETIGDLDEKFEFWYCDNDYSLTLESHKIHHALVPISQVNHHAEIIGKTAKTLDEKSKNQMTIAQNKIFKKKWNINTFKLK